VLAIITWLWGNKYSPEYVWRLHRGVARNLKQPFRFLLMTERERGLDVPAGIERHAIKDPAFCKIPGCFARLRMFNPGWQQARELDGPVVCLDLDIVITGSLDALFAHDDPFVVLHGANSSNPCPYNCSVFMFQPGAYPELWSDFSIPASYKIPFHEFPDDQGWIHHKVPRAAAWHVGPPSGIYAFRKPMWPQGDELPADARIVCFPGKRDPAAFVRQLAWIRQHWV
jgi:hypothetical protein